MSLLSSLAAPLLATLLFGTQPPPDNAYAPETTEAPADSAPQEDLPGAPMEDLPTSEDLPPTEDLPPAENLPRASLPPRGSALLHTHSAQLDTPGLLHLSFLGRYSRTKNFAELPGSGIHYSGLSRWMGTFSASYVPLSWLEAYARYELSSSSARRHAEAEPPASVSGQVLGDTYVGARFAHAVFPSFYAGADLGLHLFNVGQAMGNVRLAFAPALLLTWNAQELAPALPLVFHANFGFHLGKTSGLSPLDNRVMWQTFSWNIHSRHYASLLLALEAPLPYVSPFIEYSALFPFWNSADSAYAKANPQSLTFGAKLTALSFLTFSFGADLNLKSVAIPGVSPHPPWTLFLGLSLSTAPGASAPASSPPAADAAMPVRGRLLNASGQGPVEKAQVKLVSEYIEVDGDGLFHSHNVPPGDYVLEIQAPGYLPKTQALSHPGEDSHLVHLHPVVAHPQLALSLKRGNRLIPGQVHVRGEHAQSAFVSPEGTSSLLLRPGPQLLELIPQSGLAKIHRLELAPGQKHTLTVNVESAPPSPLVRLVNQRILFAEPLAFAPHKMELTPRGHAQLRALVDLLVRNHIQKLRIESHAESQKTEEKALQLSEQRAQVVVQALLKLGLEAERMEVLNLGDTKPAAPNVRRGRSLNRRMEFVVVDKW